MAVIKECPKGTVFAVLGYERKCFRANMPRDCYKNIYGCPMARSRGVPEPRKPHPNNYDLDVLVDVVVPNVVNTDPHLLKNDYWNDFEKSENNHTCSDTSIQGLLACSDP